MTKENLKNKLKKLFALRNMLVLAILIMVLAQFIQTQRAVRTFSTSQNNDSSLIREIGEVKEFYGKIGNDLNEVRNFLRMPKSSYAGFEIEKEVEDPDVNTNALQLALFNYVNYVGNQRLREAKVAAYTGYLNELAKSENFKIFLTGQNLSLSKINDTASGVSLEIVDAKSGSLITYYLSKDDGKFYLKNALSKQEGKYENFQKFEAGATDFLQNQKKQLIERAENLRAKQNEISIAINSKTTRDVVTKLALKMDDKFIDRDLKITYSVYNKTDELIGEIVLDSKTLEMSLVDKNDKKVALTVTDIATALPPFLEKLDTKTFIEKKADVALRDMQNMLNDKGFKLLLNQVGLKISEQPRTDGNGSRVFYDILDGNGKVLNSIVIEKATGVVNIVEPNGTNPQNLLYFQAEDKKKTLAIPKQIPNYGKASFSEKDDFNILISGSNSGLVDTMIFVHINDGKKEIRMISIPRDLFYNGRKINAFAVLYTMPELKKVLSEITGYRLDKYIKIDMYAFIEVFDLIGGVDVHLDDAVIDPTYRVVDDGKEGTLHYAPGDYHLSGVQALRLARSRHTSSDFARAERQQKILEALQDKARNFGFGDADTIYQIAKTVLSKTETDITLEEALAYYFRYQNYKIVSNNVMSSSNVLYVPPYITQEDCDKLVEAAVIASKPDPGCQGENHVYTLLPMNDDWNVIKWFFKENFGG